MPQLLNALKALPSVASRFDASEKKKKNRAPPPAADAAKKEKTKI